MKFLFFALFDSSQKAVQALRSLREDHVAVPRGLMVTVHRNHLDPVQLPLNRTNAKLRFAQGVGLGLLFGFAVGLILQALGVVANDFTAGYAAVFGGVAGGLGGVLTGSTSANAELETLAKDLGGNRVLLTVESRTGKGREEAEHIFEQFGAHVEHTSHLAHGHGG